MSRDARNKDDLAMRAVCMRKMSGGARRAAPRCAHGGSLVSLNVFLSLLRRSSILSPVLLPS